MTERIQKLINRADESVADVDNEEYKSRRAEALTKPDAVVMHETFR